MRKKVFCKNCKFAITVARLEKIDKDYVRADVDIGTSIVCMSEKNRKWNYYGEWVEKYYAYKRNKYNKCKLFQPNQATSTGGELSVVKDAI